MKNIFKSLMLVAVAAMGIACQEKFEENIAPINPNEVVMTITADMDETRTWIDEANGKVQWSEGDQLKVIENSKTYRTTTATTIAADGTAKFKVAFPANTSASEFTYNAIFPASAVTEDDADAVSAAKIKVTVKDQQNATAASFDPAADILVAKQVVADAQPTELNMQFKRLVAMGKMTLNGLPADAKISQVVFTAGASDILAGRNYVNATTGKVSEYGYFGKTNAITVNYAEVISSRNIYFISNPFTMEAGESFKVKVVCEDKSYTREVEIPEGRSLTFAEGDLATLSVDMSNAEVESVVAFAEGKYVVIAKNGTKYYAMKGVKGSGNYMTYTEVSYDGAATTITTDDDTLVWDIAAVDGGYTLQNHEGKYLYGSNSGNYAYLGDAQTLTITPVDGTNQYKIAIKDISERILAYNTNSGQERFAFYKGTQENKLYLVPVIEDNQPYFTIEQDVMSYTYDGDEIAFEVIPHNGFDAEVTATTDAEWISFVYDEPYIFAAGAPNDGAAREAVITFSAEGYPSVEITVAQDAAPGAEEDETMTIAKFLEKKDTATEYTLTGKITNVANTTYGNFDLTDATGTIYVYGLLTPEGVSQKQWAAAGLKLGDIITVKGKYNEYNGNPQIKNAVYVSHVEAPFITAKSVTVDSTATSATIEVESNVAWTVSCADASWISSYTKSGDKNGAIDVVIEANTLSENRVAVFVISSNDVTIQVKLTQTAAGVTVSYLVDEEFDNSVKSDQSGAISASTFANFSGSTTKAYKSKYGGIKLGSSSAVGYITSKSLDLSKPFTVTIDACKYSSDTGDLQIVVGSVTKTIKNSELGADGSPKTFTVEFDAASATSTIKITSVKASKGRVYIDNVKVSYAE